MNVHKKAIKRYKEHHRNKKILLGFSLLEIAILSVLIVGGSAAAYYIYESTLKTPTKVTTTAVKSSASETQPLATPQPSPTTTPSTSTPKPSSTQSSTDSSQAIEYENEAIAAQKLANQEKFCINIDTLAYGTFHNIENSASSEVDSQIATIDAENTSLGRPYQDTYAPITQVYETYNSTVNSAYSTYTSSDTSQGCQPTDTTPPSNWVVPYIGGVPGFN